MATHNNVAPFKLTNADSRFTTFPIPQERRGLWKYYEDAYKSYWVPEEISLSKDIEHFAKLTEPEQKFIKYVLAFFAASDGIVNLNLAQRFKKDVTLFEAGYFYDYQIMMENIHAHTYSLQIDTLVASAQERDQLLNAAATIPAIEVMNNFMLACVNSEASLGERLLRMACVEGIFFTGCFCAIYWFQSRGLLPGLAHANELISRDEALHTFFAMYLYTLLVDEHKLTSQEIGTIVRNAVDIACNFVCEALPKGMPGMNAELMKAYIECQADNLVALIGVDRIYNSRHDFGFMEQINLANRENFFERRVSNYSKPVKAESVDFEICEDF